MALINFPASPSLNQVYEINGVTYIYDGTKWATNTSSFDPIRVNLPGDTMTGNTDVTTINSLTWPTSNGTAGQLVTTDGAGTLGYSNVDGWQFLSGGSVSGSSNAIQFTGWPSSATVLSLRLFNMGHQGTNASTNDIMSVTLSDSNGNTTIATQIGHSHLIIGSTPYHWNAPYLSGIPLPFFGGGNGGDAEVEIIKTGTDTWRVNARGTSDAGFGPFISAGIITPNVGATPFDTVQLTSQINFRTTGVEAYMWYK